MRPVLPPPTSAPRRMLRLSAYFAPLVAASLLGIPICPFALLLGKPCPGCGMTRATLALFTGDIERAQLMNPLAVLIAPISVALVIIALAGYVRDGKTRMNHPLAMSLGLACCFALGVVWAMRWFGAFGGPVAVF